MSRSGYDYDMEQWDLIRWRGAVASAARGKRGQALLRDTLAALDAMPEKRLIESALQDEHGDVCALGACGRARGIDVAEIDPEDLEAIARAFNVSEALAREVMEINDDYHRDTPEARWSRVRAWVASKIKSDAATAADGAQ